METESAHKRRRSRNSFDETRAEWAVGSYLKIYSRSADTWYDGKVTEVISSKLTNGRRGSKSDEWLVVKYKNFKKTKRIQRNCQDIKPMPESSVLSLRAGSQCKIYSKRFSIWLQGEVLRVFTDAEGEWLRIKYFENGFGRTTEIGRFSKQLRVSEGPHPENVPALSRLSLSPAAGDKEEKTEPALAEKGKIMKGASAYYLYRSTSKEEAEQYRPQKVGADTALQSRAHEKARKGSSWNNGATMEQFDYTELMKRRVPELMAESVHFGHYNHDGDELWIHEVTAVTGFATILLIRGKYRPGFDINVECKWKGNVMVHDKRKSVRGTLLLNDISSDDAEEDWDYEVKVKKSSTEYRIAKSILEKTGNKRAVMEAIRIFINELTSKKC